MIVWTGKGILAVIVVFVSILACTALFPNDMSNYGNALGFFIGGAFSLIFGFKWNTNEEARVLVDEKTGEKIQVKNNHSLFWIKMEYWGIIFFIIGIVILFQSSIWIGLLSILVFVLLGLFLFMNVKKSYKKEEKKMKKINDIYDKVMKESENQKEEIKNEKTKEDDLSRFMPNSEKEK